MGKGQQVALYVMGLADCCRNGQALRMAGASLDGSQLTVPRSLIQNGLHLMPTLPLSALESAGMPVARQASSDCPLPSAP